MKFKCFFLGLVMMECMASAFAQGGTFGPLTWKIENRILTISGIGEMPDAYGYAGPWCVEKHTPSGGGSLSCQFNTVIIKNGVASIGKSAFAHVVGMETISLPNSVTKIREGAFINSGLLTIIIPNTVTSIGGGAFGGCEVLTSVTLPNRIVDFGINVFKGCTKLTSITNPNLIPQVISPKVFNDPDGYAPIEFNFKACTLYVPTNSVSLYKQAPVWKEFIIVGTNVGVEDIEEPDPTIFIYPNPTTGTCTITIPEDFLYESNLTLFIYDSFGKLLEQISIDNNVGNFNFKLEYKAKGIYPIVLSNGKKSYNGKIMFE